MSSEEQDRLESFADLMQRAVGLFEQALCASPRLPGELRGDLSAWLDEVDGHHPQEQKSPPGPRARVATFS